MENIYIKKEIRGGRMEVLTQERDVALYSNPEIYIIYKVVKMEPCLVHISIGTVEDSNGVPIMVDNKSKTTEISVPVTKNY